MPRPAPAAVAPAEVQETVALEATDDSGEAVQAAEAVAHAESSSGAAGGGSGAEPSERVGNGGKSRIDLRRLTSQWAAQVNRAIATRAIREYPRAALRARLQGTVLLLVHVGPDGRLQSVTVARSSGSPQLDEAALAAARALGAVPAPPEPIHRYLRPFPVPVNYTIRT